MIRKVVYLIFFLFVLFDLSYSFLQHYQMPMDGDIAESIVPAAHFEPLFDSRWGLDAICIRNNTRIPIVILPNGPLRNI